MYFIVFFSLYFLVAGGCPDLLAPECPKCMACNSKNQPIAIYVYLNASFNPTIPARVSLYASTIEHIYIYSPLPYLPVELALLTNLKGIEITAPIANATFTPGFAVFPMLRTLRILDSPLLTSEDFLKVITNANGLSYIELRGFPLSMPFPQQLFKQPLVKLILNNLNLTDSLPSFGNMNKLLYLDLSNNHFFGTLNTSYFPPNLQYLDLSSNRISGELVKLPRYLNTLNLAFNRLTGPIYAEIGIYGKVILSNNNFTSCKIIPYNTTYLDLSYNSIADEMPFSKLLEYVDVSYNYYTTIPNSKYLNVIFPTLRFLNVAGNRINSSSTLNSLSAALVISSPQDIDDCKAGTANCPNISYCSNGWYPRMSYTCTCNSGYRQEGNACFDINECEEFLPCSSKLMCINTPGSYECCPAGTMVVNGVCTDVNECMPNPLNLLNNCSRIDACVNMIGSYRCCEDNTFNSNPSILDNLCTSCTANYTKVSVGTNPFPILANYQLSYNYCLGTCENGKVISIAVSPSRGCTNFTTLKEEYCSYPCTNLIEYTSPRSAIFVLQQELLRGDFLSDLLINYTITHNLNDNISTLVIVGNNLPIDILQNLTLSIVPNIVNVEFEGNATHFVVTSTSNTTSSTISNDVLSIPAIVLPVVVSALLAMILCYYLFRDEYGLNTLPSDVAASFRLFRLPSLSNSYRGTKETGYYYQKLNKSTEQYDAILARHDFSIYQVSSITLVFNEVLLTNFVGMYAIISERLDNQADIFGKKKWQTKNDKIDIYQSVYNHFSKLVESYSWTKNRLPILPVCHGTELAIAEKICETGFASLSSLDAGWYGKGIYFTSFPSYCIPYVATKRTPCIILSWVIPGNTYPVVEKHNEEGNLVGSALKSGHHSHYIVTSSDGKCNPNGQYNELVLPQESQIVPYAIVELNICNMEDISRHWSQL